MKGKNLLIVWSVHVDFRGVLSLQSTKRTVLLFMFAVSSLHRRSLFQNKKINVVFDVWDSVSEAVSLCSACAYSKIQLLSFVMTLMLLILCLACCLDINSTSLKFVKHSSGPRVHVPRVRSSVSLPNAFQKAASVLEETAGGGRKAAWGGDERDRAEEWCSPYIPWLVASRRLISTVTAAAATSS